MESGQGIFREREKPLFDHQRAAIASCEKNRCQLVFRLPGTGKTRIGGELVASQLERDAGAKILWLSPANLIPQLHENLCAFALPSHDVFPSRKVEEGTCNVCSYDMLRLNLPFFLRLGRWDLVICDEIHKAKNRKTQTAAAMWRLRARSSRFYAFTGTPFQNTPYEFFDLVSLCLGRDISVICEQTLEYRSPKYTPIRDWLRRLGVKMNRKNQGPIVGVRKTTELHGLIRPVVDYVQPGKYLAECHLPRVEISTRRVPLTKEEEKRYRQCLRAFSRKKKFRNFLSDNLDDDALDGYFKGLSSLRTIALGDSKANAALELVREALRKDEDNRVLVFSNFVEKGLLPVSEVFKRAGLPFILYDGGVAFSKRDEMVNRFRSGAVRVMLMSPVGFEGLDLYGTTHVIILDSHYNPDREKQLMSRAIRAYSKVGRIEVVKLSSVSASIRVPLVDEAIERISERKRTLAQMMEDVLVEV